MRKRRGRCGGGCVVFTEQCECFARVRRCVELKSERSIEKETIAENKQQQPPLSPLVPPSAGAGRRRRRRRLGRRAAGEQHLRPLVPPPQEVRWLLSDGIAESVRGACVVVYPCRREPPAAEARPSKQDAIMRSLDTCMAFRL